MTTSTPRQQRDQASPYQLVRQYRARLTRRLQEYRSSKAGAPVVELLGHPQIKSHNALLLATQLELAALSSASKFLVAPSAVAMTRFFFLPDTSTDNRLRYLPPEPCWIEYENTLRPGAGYSGNVSNDRLPRIIWFAPLYADQTWKRAAEAKLLSSRESGSGQFLWQQSSILRDMWSLVILDEQLRVFFAAHYRESTNSWELPPGYEMLCPSHGCSGELLGNRRLVCPCTSCGKKLLFWTRWVACSLLVLSGLLQQEIEAEPPTQVPQAMLPSGTAKKNQHLPAHARPAPNEFRRVEWDASLSQQCNPSSCNKRGSWVQKRLAISPQSVVKVLVPERMRHLRHPRFRIMRGKTVTVCPHTVYMTLEGAKRYFERLGQTNTVIRVVASRFDGSSREEKRAHGESAHLS